PASSRSARRARSCSCRRRPRAGRSRGRRCPPRWRAARPRGESRCGCARRRCVASVCREQPRFLSSSRSSLDKIARPFVFLFSRTNDRTNYRNEDGLMTGTATLDLAAVKARQQVTWASGDFAEIATLIVPVAEQLADAADLRAGSTVLDVATGSGNAAIAA